MALDKGHPFSRILGDPNFDRYERDVDTELRGIKNRLDRTETLASGAAATAAVVGGSAPDVTINSISESGVTIDGTVWSEVSMTYTAPTDITNFAGVYAAVKNYRGSAEIVKEYEHTFLGAAGAAATFKFRLYRTNETITVYLVSKNKVGGSRDDWQNAPSTTVTLDGNVSAPTTPSGLTATATMFGVSLTWNENTESNLAAYEVYFNSSNNSGTASKIATVQATKTGTASYLHATANFNATNYYWVKAINTADLPSSFSAVASNTPLAFTTLTGVNFLENPGLEITAAPNSGHIAYQWKPGSNVGGVFTAQRDTTAAQSHTGNANLYFSIAPSSTIPAGTRYYADVEQQTKIPIVAGQQYVVSFYANSQRLSGPTAGITYSMGAVLNLYDNTDTIVSQLTVFSSTTGGFPYFLTRKVVTIPAAGANPWAYAKLLAYADATNTTGAPITITNSLEWDVRYDSWSIVKQSNTQENAPVNSNGFANIAQLSSVAGSTTINVAAFTLQYGFGTVSYNSGSVNPGAFGTYYVYVDDPNYTGGAVTYQATLTTTTLTAAEGRIYLGKITTSAGSGGSGGGSACVEEGTPVSYYPDSEVVETLVSNSEWVEIDTPNGRLAMAPGTLVSVFKRADTLQAGDLVELEGGRWYELRSPPTCTHRPSMKVKRLVEPWHTYFARGVRVHNLKPV